MASPDVVTGGVAGEFRQAAGVTGTTRQGAYNEAIVNDSGYGRYFEACRNGRLFIASTTAAGFSIANATFTAPLAATSTTIIGIFNPAGNTKAAVITKAIIGVLPVAGTTTAEPVWVAATPNGGITATAANVTFASGRLDAAAPTTMKGYANVPLTGLVNPIALGPFGASATGTSAAATTTSLFTDEVAGALIIPPGGFLGVMVTTTPVSTPNANGCMYFVECDWPL